MLRIYHRVKLNPDLLVPEKIEVDLDSGNPLGNYMKGKVSTTLPAGKVVGATWNPYAFEAVGSTVEEPQSYIALPPLPTWSQTDLTILDSRNLDITVTTDISDYRHKSGGHVLGFKNIHMLNKADANITLVWETLGKMPICGEIVFMIEQENCECD